MPTTMGYTKPTIGAQDQAEVLDTLIEDVDDDIYTLDTAMRAFNTNATLVANGHEAGSETTPVTALVAVSEEVTNARGSALTLDARLDISLNEDGSLKSTTAAADQWLDTSMTSPTYASASTFTIAGDVTSILLPGRPIKIDYSVSADKFYRVRNATHSGGTTTVTVWTDDPAVSNAGGETMTAVYYQSYSGQQIPDLDASDFTPGAFPADYIAWMSSGSVDVYYYDGSTYTNPFTVDASRSKTNSGDVARMEYSSGLKVGITYASLGGNISTIQYQIMKAGTDTTISTKTFTYDGTTNNVTDVDRT